MEKQKWIVCYIPVSYTHLDVYKRQAQRRATQQEADDLRSNRKKISKQIGALMAQGKKEEADAVKEQVTKNAERLAELEKLEAELGEKVKKIMMIIPNIIDPSVPIGKDDSENVEDVYKRQDIARGNG